MSDEAFFAPPFFSFSTTSSGVIEENAVREPTTSSGVIEENAFRPTLRGLLLGEILVDVEELMLKTFAPLLAPPTTTWSFVALLVEQPFEKAPLTTLFVVATAATAAAEAVSAARSVLLCARAAR